MNKYYNPSIQSIDKLLRRPTFDTDAIEKTVKEIFKEVQIKGDTAVLKYTSYFDGVMLDQIEVDEEEINEAIKQVPDDLKNAILQAKGNIEKFHTVQRTEGISVITTEGVYCLNEKRPISKVGLYIPGGTAPLFSTVLMLAVPAALAGCDEIILCTPPDAEGKINPAILYTANLCGVKRIFKVGGIQAIAAMTFGTKAIPSVYKLFGPGNQFVTVAKQYATRYGLAIDMPAGPSELLIVADDSADARFIAADLLSQAEHGKDSQVILVTTSKKLLEKVEEQLDIQIQALPRRVIAEQAIANSKLIFVQKDKEALELINKYGPEHLMICTINEDFYVRGIQNAGSVFVGNYTPESAGDYASGTNHTLPTNGCSKGYSGISLDSFLKTISFQKISKAGIRNIGQTIQVMAEAEGLAAHKNAVSIRLKVINNE